MAVISADAPSRWLLSGVAAIATHGAVLLGAPDAAVVRNATPEPLWMSVVVAEQSSATAEPSGGGASALTKPSVAAPRRRPAVAPVRASAVSHVSSESRIAPAAQEAPSIATAAAAAGLAEGAHGTGALAGVGAGSGLAGFGSGSGSGIGVATTRPALLASRNPCIGYFPAGAHVDHGRVQIQVHVDETGHARASEVVVEAPLGNDFGRAARACASALRFAPARDALGAAVAADAKLELHFHRS
jgi:hypothetical protein